MVIFLNLLLSLALAEDEKTVIYQIQHENHCLQLDHESIYSRTSGVECKDSKKQNFTLVYNKKDDTYFIKSNDKYCLAPEQMGRDKNKRIIQINCISENFNKWKKIPYVGDPEKKFVFKNVESKKCISFAEVPIREDDCGSNNIFQQALMLKEIQTIYSPNPLGGRRPSPMDDQKGAAH